jgi:hypothetical protein
MSEKLYSVSEHLSTALREVQRADTGHNPSVAPIRVAAVRLALRERQLAPAELGKHSAAQEVRLALGLLPAEQEEAFGEAAGAFGKSGSQH